MDKTHESPMSATFLLPTAVALMYLQAVSPRAGVGGCTTSLDVASTLRRCFTVVCLTPEHH